MAAASRRTVEDLARELERLPTVMQREALRPATRIARIAGYRAGLRELARETGTQPVKWSASHRVYTSVQPDGTTARAWLGIAPYQTGRVSARRKVYAEFPPGYDPAPAVGEVMQQTYLRVASGRLKELLEGG